jgi:hypothetical protein
VVDEKDGAAGSQTSWSGVSSRKRQVREFSIFNVVDGEQHGVGSKPNYNVGAYPSTSAEENQQMKGWAIRKKLKSVR